MSQLTIELNKRAYDRLKHLSEETRTKTDTVCRLILEAFTREPPERGGGRIIAGRSVNGKLIVIDWPRFIQFIESEDIRGT